jgi:hypothetical protein
MFFGLNNKAHLFLVFFFFIGCFSNLQAKVFKEENVYKEKNIDKYNKLNHVASVAKITLGVVSSLMMFTCVNSIITSLKSYRNLGKDDMQYLGSEFMKGAKKNAIVQSVKSFVFYGTIMTFCLIEGINYFRSLQKSKKVSLKKKNEDKSKRSPKNKSLILE